MKAYSVWDQPKIDHIAGKTIYPMTIYPGRSVMGIGHCGREGGRLPRDRPTTLLRALNST